ncbi:MAG TPA: TonB family protein [Thermoanaerobaculia bacterium]|nr:TonB family protein [Thermoanaerobaculia bacterium]
MFDTSVVRPRAVTAPRRLGLFILSVSLHSAIAVAAIAMSVAAVEFPRQAPRQMEMLQPLATVSLPPALGPRGDGGKPKEVSQPPVKLQDAPPRELTAPVEVPEEIPTIENPLATSLTGGATTAGTDAAQGEGGGDPLGVEGGVGDGPAAIGGMPGDGVPRVPGGEVHPARVLRRVEPRYPSSMLPVRAAAVVTVRCIIDRHGRISDPEIIRSSWPPFNQSVLDAIRQWTFAPGTMHGRPVDTWFELTVTFRVR